MSSALDKLRDEIITYQAAKRDLLKWKLILTGSVSAVGLGFTGSTIPKAHLALCVVPLVAAYCDLLIRDCDLRIATKAHFILQHGEDMYSKYEAFLRKPPISNTNLWALDNAAILASSLLMCAFVLGMGVCHGFAAQWVTDLSWMWLVAAATVGAGVVIWVDRAYQTKNQQMGEGIQANQTLDGSGRSGGSQMER